MAHSRDLLILTLLTLLNIRHSTQEDPLKVDYDIIDKLLKFMEQEAELAKQCHFYLSASIVLDDKIQDWLLEHSRGMTSIDLQYLSTLGNSRLRRYWSASKSALLIDDGSNITRAQDLLDRVGVPHKVLIIADFDDMDHIAHSYLKKRSFDMVVITSDAVQVYCQGFGNQSVISAADLKSCNDFLPVLQKSHIQVSIGARPPYALSSDGQLKGPDIEILNLIKDKYGFEYTLKQEANFGIATLPNGTSFGYLASLGSRESEFALGELLASLDRYKYADFSTPMYFTQVGYSTPLPQRQSAFTTILYPMDLTTWLSMFFSMVVVMGILVLIDYLYGKQHPLHYKFYDLALTFAMVIQYNTPHSWFNFKSFASRRVLLCFWLPVTMFVSSGYKSVLLTKLTFIEYQNPINTAEDILNSGLPVIIPALTITDVIMKESKLPVYQRIYKEQVVGKNGLVPYNGMFPPWVYQKMNEGTIIVCSDIITFNLSESHVATELLMQQTTHLMYPHNSRFRPLADRQIAQLRAMGFLDFFFNKYYNSGRSASRGGVSWTNDSGAITIDHVLPMLLVALLGYTVAGIVFIGLEMTSRLAKRTLLL